MKIYWLILLTNPEPVLLSLFFVEFPITFSHYAYIGTQNFEHKRAQNFIKHKILMKDFDGFS